MKKFDTVADLITMLGKLPPDALVTEAKVNYLRRDTLAGGSVRVNPPEWADNEFLAPAVKDAVRRAVAKQEALTHA